MMDSLPHKSHGVLMVRFEGSINRILPFDLPSLKLTAKASDNRYSQKEIHLPTIGIFRGELLVSGRVVGGCDSTHLKNLCNLSSNWIVYFSFPPICWGENRKNL